VALVALALLLALGGCGGRGQNGDAGQDRATITLRTDPATPTSGPARLIIHLTTPEGAPLTGARVKVEGNMSHAGMQPVNGEAKEQGGSDYVVENFRFTMGGDWVLIVRATLTDGTEVQRTFPIAGVSGMVVRAPLPRG
jgi:hypothetical protein